MRFRDEIINHLRGRLGTSADPADIIDELYGCGAIDERSARTFVAYNEFVKRYQQHARSPRSIMHEVADEIDVDFVTVFRIVHKVQQLHRVQ